MQTLMIRKAAILIPDRIDWRTRNITRNKKAHFLMIKESIHQKHITILNVYIPNKCVLKYGRQKNDRPKKINEQFKIVVWYFSIFLSETESMGRQKINTDIEELNITLNQLNLIDIYITLHPTMTEYIFFSSEHGTFMKMGHKTSLPEYKRIGIIYSIFSGQNGIQF